jgi:hypothetical protein
MKATFENGKLILSEPVSIGERVFMENINTVVTYGWGKTVEMEVSDQAENPVTGYTVELRLKLVIPSEFEDDLTGTGAVVKKESRCPYCGGENH